VTCETKTLFYRDFYSWNALKTDCSTLQANVYVCIGVAGAATTSASGPAAAAASTSGQ